VILYLDFRLDDAGGPVTAGQAYERNGTLEGRAAEDALLVADHVTVAVHGFNVTRPAGRQSLGDFVAALARQQPAGPILAVLWPGDVNLGPLSFLSYPVEGNDADDTACALARYLDRVLRPDTTLSFVSHSLGARVVFGAISQLDRKKFGVREVCVMAPAVDDSSVSDPGSYRVAADSSVRVSVLASRQDNVLKWAYPIGDFVQALLFFWKDAPGGALGRFGARPYRDLPVPDEVVSTLIPDRDKVDHGDYLFSPAPDPRQRRAAAFADTVLAGDDTPAW
jgi:hypothetical protein